MLDNGVKILKVATTNVQDDERGDRFSVQTNEIVQKGGHKLRYGLLLTISFLAHEFPHVGRFIFQVENFYAEACHFAGK